MLVRKGQFVAVGGRGGRERGTIGAPTGELLHHLHAPGQVIGMGIVAGTAIPGTVERVIAIVGDLAVVQVGGGAIAVVVGPY